MIEGFANVYVALSCKYVVDPVMFGALADEVDELFIKHVPWHPGVPSTHLNFLHGRYVRVIVFTFYPMLCFKVVYLIHIFLISRLIMEHFFPIPFAFLSEEPLGEKHACKMLKKIKIDLFDSQDFS